MFYQNELLDLKDKILKGKYNCNIYRIIYNLRAYNESRILRVLIREINGPLILQLITIYIISIRLTNH
jgi:hypothetical protein